jgi:hypothetical protein
MASGGPVTSISIAPQKQFAKCDILHPFKISRNRKHARHRSLAKLRVAFAHADI